MSAKKNLARDIARVKTLFDGVVTAKAALDQQDAQCAEILTRIGTFTARKNELTAQLKQAEATSGKAVIQMEARLRAYGVLFSIANIVWQANQVVLILLKFHKALEKAKKRRAALYTDHLNRQAAFAEVEATVNTTMTNAHAELARFEANLADEESATASIDRGFAGFSISMLTTPGAPPAALTFSSAKSEEDDDDIEALLALPAPSRAAAAVQDLDDYLDSTEEEPALSSPATPTSSGKKRLIRKTKA